MDGMKEVKFTVPGTPVSKARARTFWDAKTGSYRSVTPEKTASYEGIVKLFYQHCAGGAVFDLGTPVAIEITARFEPARSESKKRRNLMLAGEIRHTRKPDIDNVVKTVMDALNKLAWHDDSQVISIKAEKRYSEVAGLDVVIKSAE